VATAAPFHVAAVTWAGAHTSSGAATVVSPVSARVAPVTVAERTSSGPLTMTVPALVVNCQNVAAAVSSASSSSSGGVVPPGVTRTRLTPLWV
jgi:hypothetical protein